MQFTAKKSEFLSHLARCKAVANSKSTMPILGSVLLVVGADSVLCQATDLSLSVTGKCAAADTEPGAFAVDAASLLDRVRAMPDGPISFSIKKDRLDIKAKGSSRRFTLSAIPGSEFPSMPTLDDAKEIGSFAGAEIAMAIGSVAFAISADDTRLHLSSLLAKFTGKRLILAATDGHRLALTELDAKSKPADLLIPRRGVVELQRLCADSGTVTLHHSGYNLHAMSEGTRITVKLTDAQFPPYEQVIPKEGTPFVVNREALLGSLRAVAVAASDATSGVKVEIDRVKVRLSAQSADGGEGADEVPIHWLGEDSHVGLNARYVLDVLGALTCEDVALTLGGELEPVVIRPSASKDYTAVVMPMRI